MKLHIRESDYDEIQKPLKRTFGYHFYSSMTDEDFFIISDNKRLCEKYGMELVDILSKGDSELSDEWFNTFFDNPPKGVYMTNPEHDFCEYNKLTRSWIVELDGGWGDSYSIDLVGEYKSRF